MLPLTSPYSDRVLDDSLFCSNLQNPFISYAQLSVYVTADRHISTPLLFLLMLAKMMNRS
jgi:hypothetical protein